MSKSLKIGILISSIFILLVTLGFILKPYAIEYLEEWIKSEVEKIENLTAGELHISVLDREIVLDDAKYESLEQGIKLTIERIDVDGFSLYQLLFKKHLAIDKLAITAPEYSKYEREENKVEKNSQSLERKLKQLSFKNIEVLKGNAQLFSTDSSLVHQIHEISGEFEGIKIDLTKKFTVSELEYTNFNISIDSSFLFQNSKHFLTSKKVTLNTSNGIVVKELNYYPNKIYKSGNRKDKYRVNWTEAKIDSLHLLLDWNLLQKEQQLHANTLTISQLDYSSLIDKNYPRKDVAEKPLPHEMIQQLNFPLTLDSIVVVNSRFEYSETKQDRNDKGTIYFTEFNATMENVTNDSILLSQNGQMKASIETKLMGQSLLAVIIDYDLASAAGNHRIHGNIENFDLTELNKVFMPLALIRFETGHLTKMDFNYYLNSSVSEGTMDFRYEDLKVSVFDDGKEYKPEIVGKIISGIANSFVIRKSNPLRGHYLKGDIAFTREKDKSFLTFWWKSLFSGMKSTVIRNDLNQ